VTDLFFFKKHIRVLDFGINFYLSTSRKLQSSMSYSHFINLSVSRKMVLSMGKIEISVIIIIIILLVE